MMTFWPALALAFAGMRTPPHAGAVRAASDPSRHRSAGLVHDSCGLRGDMIEADCGYGLPTTRAFFDEVDTGSSKKMRHDKDLERRSDSIGSERALEPFRRR